MLKLTGRLDLIDHYRVYKTSNKNYLVIPAVYFR